MQVEKEYATAHPYVFCVCMNHNTYITVLKSTCKLISILNPQFHVQIMCNWKKKLHIHMYFLVHESQCIYNGSTINLIGIFLILIYSLYRKLTLKARTNLILDHSISRAIKYQKNMQLHIHMYIWCTNHNTYI
jgi:hypothetical protein